MATLDLQFHPEARAWKPSEQDLAALQAYFPYQGMVAKILPRRMANEVLGKDLGPYAFRAFTRGPMSYLFVDSTETPKSVAWLLAHELTHQLVARTPTLRRAFSDAASLEGHRAGDCFHRNDPEEKFCDGIATRLIGERLDREWWRARTLDPRVVDGRVVDRRTSDRRISRLR